MRCLAYIGLSLLGINAAGAGELGSAPLPARAPTRQRHPIRSSRPRRPPMSRRRRLASATVAAVSPYSFEIGARYWYSTGKFSKDLFDDPRSSDLLNSRLTYDGLTAHSFEAFGRVNLPSGLFLKGYAGVSGLSSGKLNDEDFPFPGFPYSSTLSDQRGGKLNYAMADLGYRYAANPRANVLLFGGFGYIGEKVNAYGCAQIAGNPFVCAPAIGADVLAITEDAHWGLVRLGVGVDFKIMDRLTLNAEAAWVPYAQINSRDSHWLRIGTTPGSFAGSIPQDASGNGFQLEALLNYRSGIASTSASAGATGGSTRGSSDLEQTVVGAVSPTSQPMHFTSERYGMFVQGSYKFGAM